MGLAHSSRLSSRDSQAWWKSILPVFRHAIFRSPDVVLYSSLESFFYFCGVLIVEENLQYVVLPVVDIEEVSPQLLQWGVMEQHR